MTRLTLLASLGGRSSYRLQAEVNRAGRLRGALPHFKSHDGMIEKTAESVRVRIQPKARLMPQFDRDLFQRNGPFFPSTL